jgi:hypothetical protein
MKHIHTCLAVLVLLVLVLALAACDGNFQENPLGYSFVGKNSSNNLHHPVPLTPSHAATIPHLRPYGLGLPPDAFAKQYGPSLSPSQPPTQYWFQATLDAFPGGSVMIVGFDRSSSDSLPRATELSYVAGDHHPTTVTQAATLAESFLPDDAKGPSVLHLYDAHANTCLSETYSSTTLASFFPAQDFLDQNGKLAKAGTVTLSLFPHYPRSTDSFGNPSDTHVDSDTPDQPNAVSSFLLTLGTKSYC